MGPPWIIQACLALLPMLGLAPCRWPTCSAGGAARRQVQLPVLRQRRFSRARQMPGGSCTTCPRRQPCGRLGRPQRLSCGRNKEAGSRSLAPRRRGAPLRAPGRKAQGRGASAASRRPSRLSFRSQTLVPLASRLRWGRLAGHDSRRCRLRCPRASGCPPCDRSWGRVQQEKVARTRFHSCAPL